MGKVESWVLISFTWIVLCQSQFSSNVGTPSPNDNRPLISRSPVQKSGQIDYWPNLDKQYSRWKATHTDWVREQTYCMIWCPTHNSTLIRKYSQKQIDKAEKSYQNYMNDEVFTSSPFSSMYESPWPRTESKSGMFCCQICTSECFRTIKDDLNRGSFEDVTITTVSKMNRLESFQNLLALWEGPLIAVFYLEDKRDIDRLANVVANASNVMIHYYLRNPKLDSKLLNPWNSISSNGTRTPLFPINALRNYVNDQVTSRFMFPIDVDFLPSNNLYRYFKARSKSWKIKDKSAFVIPQWEIRECALEVFKTAESLSLTFEELYNYAKRGYLKPFHSIMSRFNFSDQNLTRIDLYDEACRQNTTELDHFDALKYTRYNQWMDISILQQNQRDMRNELIKIPGSLTFHRRSMNWEPYVIIQRFHSCGMIPRYNELFQGRNMNKVSWISHLRLVKQFHFFLVSEHFLLHQNHALDEPQRFDFFRGLMNKVFTMMLGESRSDDQCYSKIISIPDSITLADSINPAHGFKVKSFEFSKMKSRKRGELLELKATNPEKISVEKSNIVNDVTMFEGEISQYTQSFEIFQANEVIFVVCLLLCFALFVGLKIRTSFKARRLQAGMIKVSTRV